MGSSPTTEIQSKHLSASQFNNTTHTHTHMHTLLPTVAHTIRRHLFWISRRIKQLSAQSVAWFAAFCFLQFRTLREGRPSDPSSVRLSVRPPSSQPRLPAHLPACLPACLSVRGKTQSDATLRAFLFIRVLYWRNPDFAFYAPIA